MRFRIFAFAILALVGHLARAQTTGSISANTQCVTVAQGAIDPTRSSTVTIEITGTWSATLQPKVSLHGKAAANTAVTPKGSTSSQSTITANGVYSADVSGVDLFQVCATAYTSGTATIDLNVSTGIATNLLGGGGGGGCIATVATLSSSCGTQAGTLASVTDGSTSSDCTVGGGANKNACIYSGSAWAFAGSSGSAPNFGQVTTGTNTGQTDTIGSGGTLNVASGAVIDFSLIGTGTFKIPSAPGFTASATKMLGFDTTAGRIHGWNGADAVWMPWPSTPGYSSCIGTPCTAWTTPYSATVTRIPFGGGSGLFTDEAGFYFANLSPYDTLTLGDDSTGTGQLQLNIAGKGYFFQLIPNGNMDKTIAFQNPNESGAGPYTLVAQGDAFTGNAETATGAAAAGTECSAGQAARGVDASWNAKDCFTPSGGSGVPNPSANGIVQCTGTNCSTSAAIAASGAKCYPFQGSGGTGCDSPSGAGTVTSVAVTVPAGLNVSPASITSSGTFAFVWASGYGFDGSGNFAVPGNLTASGTITTNGTTTPPESLWLCNTIPFNLPDTNHSAVGTDTIANGCKPGYANPSGALVHFDTLAPLISPSFTTPTLGAATATTVNGLTPTALTTGFSIAGGTTPKTLTVDATVSTSALAPSASPTLTTASITPQFINCYANCSPTVAQLSNAILGNCSASACQSGSSASVITGPTPAAGMNFIIIVGGAVTGHNYEYSSVTNGTTAANIYLDGSASGVTNIIFANPAIGNSFSCFSFPAGSSAYYLKCTTLAGTSTSS